MAVESSLANVKISGNTFDAGTTSDGAANITYTYSQHLSTFASALISGNTFSGASSTEDMVLLTNCSCSVLNNKFIRGSTSINSYIKCTNTGSADTIDQVITNNIFDQSTVDGTNDLLVSGLSETSVYHKNVNQVIYVPVVLGTGGGSSDTTIISGLTAQNIISYFIVTATTTGGLTFRNKVNLNAALPDGVRIIEFKLGLYAVQSGATLVAGTANQLSVRISAVNHMSQSEYATGTNSILDSKVALNNSLSGDPDFTIANTYAIATNFTALQSATQYITTTVDDDRFHNTSDRMLILIINQDINLSVAGSVNWYYSPFVFKCIW